MHIHIDGSLNHEQNKQHIPHTFTVPDGATRLDIRFDYHPKASQGQMLTNDLSLTLFDPQGARGARHNNPVRDLTITVHSATSGYTAGALQPGEWTVWIDSHRVLPPDTIHYTFDIDIRSEAVTEPDSVWTPGKVTPRGQGWYRGDLHGHTLHSDGAWDVPEFVQYARDYKLDFVTLTDHNTVSPLAQHDSLASDDLLTMGGTELTTYYGHALALGVRQWQEWRAGFNGMTMPQLAEQVMKNGALFIIAHPHSIGDPYCTGCDWGYPDMMPGNARCVEIWNGLWNGDSGNEQALQLWYGWLNLGYRMVATAGTDIHGPMQDEAPGFNVVYASEFSERAILDAVRQGHLYLSSRPVLSLTAVNDRGEQAMMGDVLGGDTIDLALSWSQCDDGDAVRIIVDGQVNQTLMGAAQGDYQRPLDPYSNQWAVVEVRNGHGELRAITNPLFLGSAESWR